MSAEGTMITTTSGMPTITLSIRIERITFTTVLPMSSVHSSKLPRLRSGRIFSAYRMSLLSFDPCMMTCRSSSVNDLCARRYDPAQSPPQCRGTGEWRT